jgi:hypothetical protein
MEVQERERSIYIPGKGIYYAEMGEDMIMMSLVTAGEAIKFVMTMGCDELTCGFNLLKEGRIIFSIPLMEALKNIKQDGNCAEDTEDTEIEDDSGREVLDS